MTTTDVLREQQRTADSSPSAKSAADERRVTAWIGQGVVIEGRITSAQDLRIDGKVDGTVELGNHGLIVGAGADIRGDLTARSILISGAVIGNVTATERVDLQPTASVEGDISAPRLAMSHGAVVRGNIDARGNRMSKVSTGEAGTPRADSGSAPG